MTREKKGSSVQERIERFFKKDVFDKLRAMNPTFTDKVIPIHGDLYQPDLGLSAEDRERLVKNVNIIIHNASMVYFEAKVSVLLRINVLGTQKMLELAAECPNLNAFVYVSTAYSHHYMNPIEEKFYAPPCGLKMIEDIIRADEENAAGLSKEALNDIIGKWLNQYAFSKAVTEGVVEDFAKRSSLPCIIYRPSIIIHAMREPYRGWIETKNGPVILLALQAFGLLHVVPMGPGVISDYVPVDLATNGLLSAIWDYAVHRESNEPQVYNCGSSDWNPLSFHTYCPNYIKSIEKYPSSKIAWYPFMFLVGNIYIFFVLHVLFHVFPAIVADVVLMIQRKKPNNSKKSDGQIRNFYAGKHIFLTGCTGFYGSFILEKLLRTCTEIGNVYIMTREKKGFSVQERMERFFKKDVSKLYSQ
ncbi:putative fatty acyl-CoA reductase CG8306 [Ceratina calcarata]|uniref:Fatty acyl-CoA reductase n=1 Tax=Ceratina calcarata TaxID=156304 RepID=A0AAJ7WFG3_9HYME|nr:putative fatty acyl-CoA reductase CG8306 [Ceratina calcarata]